MILAFVILALIIPSVSVALGYVVGRSQRNYNRGRADGYNAGIRHGEKARDALRARAEELEAALDELCETDLEAAVDEIGEPFVHAVERANGEIELVGDDTFTMLNGAPERWDDSVPPGGYVCAVCGTPVESEPCPVHGGRP